MKVFSVALLGFCCLGVFSKCKKENGDGFNTASLGPYTPLGIGALWNSRLPSANIWRGCPSGQKLTIKSLKVFTQGPKPKFFKRALQPRFTVHTTAENDKKKTKKASTGIFETSCFEVSNVAFNTQSASAEISCKNFRKGCEIFYKFEHTCSPGRRLLAATSSSTPDRALLAATGGEGATGEGEGATGEGATGEGEGNANEWNAPCPVVTGIKASCEETDSCNIGDVSDADFEAVCNEYRTDSACKASITQATDVLDDYQYYCDPKPDFDGAGCPEFQRVNASCHSAYGADCSVEKVTSSDVDAVCGEYRSVSACTTRVQEFPYYYSTYEQYCMLETDSAEGAAPSAAAAPSPVLSTEDAAPSGAPTNVLGASLWVVGGLWAVAGF